VGNTKIGSSSKTYGGKTLDWWYIL
jgi:hypothetical protein